MSCCMVGWTKVFLTTPYLEKGYSCFEDHCKSGLLSGTGLTSAYLSWLRPSLMLL